MLTTPRIAPSLRPGMHAATFGGNPIAARAGIAMLETVEREGLLAAAQRLGRLFRARLEALQAQCEIIREVRVLGLMIGIELLVDATPVVRSCLERKLLVNRTQGNVIRLLPAMNLTDEQAEEGCDQLAAAITELATSATRN
jgi:acetylornithine/succinyldiaminopimelate/putrescine aminotransferase